MYIDPKDCGKVKLEVRDWKNGGNKIVYLRCKKPTECPICAADSVRPYVKPILDAGQVFSYRIHDDDWNAARQHLHRTDSSGYGKYPIDNDHFILVVAQEINKDFAVQESITDWDSVVLKTHDLEGKRRSATGIFAKSKEEEPSDLFEITWPEPIFMKKDGESVPVSMLPDIIRTLLQYFTPIDELTRNNVDMYLDERARLKAALITLYYEDYVLVGFNTVTKLVSEASLKKWNIIPMYNPEKAVLDNSIGATALKMIYSRDIPEYKDKSRDLPAWTDYKDEAEKLFDEMFSGKDWGAE